LLPFAAFCGFPPIPSATAYGLLSLVNLIGMIAAGWLTDRVNRPMLLAAIYMLRALTFILLGSIPGTSIEMLFLFAVLFGAVDYSTVPVTASLVASHVGIKTMGLAMGLISAGHALGGAMGAFAGGYIFTATQTYTLVWTGSVWLAVGAGALALFLKAHPITKAAAS
jgi:MFS family permease